MPAFLKKLIVSFQISVLLLGFLPLFPVYALVSDCRATINPTQVPSGSISNFTLTVENTSANDIVWIKITRPSANFILGNIIATGWTKNISTENITLTNGSLSAGSTRILTLFGVEASNVNAPNANWLVEVSDQGSGANSTACTGTLGVQIGNPDTNVPVISNISVSSITENSATISWSSDELSTSKVNYGTNTFYGSSSTSSTLTLSHSLTLTNLAPNTGYHFQVQSSDASGNTGTSSDNTFLTQTPLSITPTTQKPQTSVVAGDNSPPEVVLTTDFTKIYKKAPKISGLAKDNVEVTSIEYSTDGGQNWLLVDSTNAVKKGETSFEFQPLNLPDGNYEILARAFDSSENEGTSETAILVIDFLAPQIGPNSISYGSQAAVSKDNTIFAVIGVDQKITLSAVGGPTTVVVKAVSDEKVEKVFSLTRTRGTNLWSGLLAFEKPGSYQLNAAAVDGANNKVERKINNVFVSESSKVTDENNEPVKDASISVYYFETESQRWSLWDGASFGQENPQKSSSEGKINFFLPAGKYYLAVSADGWRDLKSEIFSFTTGQPLKASIKMVPKTGIDLFSFYLVLPSFKNGTVSISTNDSLTENKTTDSLKGKDLPTFTLTDTEKEVVVSSSFAGKPTLLSFLSTWNRGSEEQLSELNDLVRNQNYNVYVIVSFESLEKVASYKSLGEYNPKFLVDQSGETLFKLDVLTQPLHILVKKDLVIAKSMNGVFMKKELQDLLDNL